MILRVLVLLSSIWLEPVSEPPLPLENTFLDCAASIGTCSLPLLLVTQVSIAQVAGDDDQRTGSTGRFIKESHALQETESRNEKIDPVLREEMADDTMQAILREMEREDQERLATIKRLERRIAKLKTSVEKRQDPNYRSRIAKQRYDALMAAEATSNKDAFQPSESQILDELEKDPRFSDVLTNIKLLRDEVERLSTFLKPNSRELRQFRQEIDRLEEKRQGMVEERRPRIVERLRRQTVRGKDQGSGRPGDGDTTLARQQADNATASQSYRILDSHIEQIHKRQDGGHDALVRFNFVIIDKQTRTGKCPRP